MGSRAKVKPVDGIQTIARNGLHDTSSAYDRERYGQLYTMIAIVHLCQPIGGELTLSHKGLALRYWSVDKIGDWHANHQECARAAYEMWRAEGVRPAISD